MALYLFLFSFLCVAQSGVLCASSSTADELSDRLHDHSDVSFKTFPDSEEVITPDQISSLCVQDNDSDNYRGDLFESDSEVLTPRVDVGLLEQQVASGASEFSSFEDKSCTNSSCYTPPFEGTVEYDDSCFADDEGSIGEYISEDDYSGFESSNNESTDSNSADEISDFDADEYDEEDSCG